LQPGGNMGRLQCINCMNTQYQMQAPKEVRLLFGQEKGSLGE